MLKMRIKWSNIPIPGAYLISLIAGIVVHILIPWRFFTKPWAAHAFGWPIVIIGLSLAAWAVLTVSEINVEHPRKLITYGPYARSRNPMYLAWTCINIGIALAVNTIWPAVFLPGAFLYTHLFTIPREERMLSKAFHDEYQQYKKKVRRYL